MIYLKCQKNVLSGNWNFKTQKLGEKSWNFESQIKLKTNKVVLTYAKRLLLKFIKFQ